MISPKRWTVWHWAGLSAAVAGAALTYAWVRRPRPVPARLRGPRKGEAP